MLIGRCGGPSPGGTDLAYASNLTGTIALADTGFGRNFVSLSAGNFTTNDTAVFADLSSGGIRGINILEAGEYFVWISCVGQSNAAPAAGSYISCDTSSSIGQEVDASQYGGWFKTDATPLYSAAATFCWGALVQAPSDPPPTFIRARAGQNSGGAIGLQLWMTIVRVTTRTVS